MAKKQTRVREPERVYRLKIPLYLRERRDVPGVLTRPPQPRVVRGRSAEIRADDGYLGFFPDVESEYGECITTFTMAYSDRQAFAKYLSRCGLRKGDIEGVYDLVLPRVLVTEEQARPTEQRPKPKKKRKGNQDKFLVRVPFKYRRRHNLQPDYETWFKPNEDSDLTPEQTALRRVLMGSLDWRDAMQVYHGTVGPTDKHQEGAFMRKYPWVEVLEPGMEQGTLF